MPVTFDFYASPSPDASDKPRKYHARVVGGWTVEEQEILEQIENRSALTQGDIKAVLAELKAEIVGQLQQGNRVHLPGIGYFSLSLSAPKEASPTSIHAQNIRVKNIEFRAEQDLKKAVTTGIEFRRTSVKRHSNRLDSSEVDALLTGYFQKNTFITRRKMETLCGFTSSMAKLHLSRLVKEGRLVNVNTRQSPVYEPVQGCYGKV
ncbi:HU family DNA-binding protein [uncultured Bacteroides sp.]|uniref:HU family DNA-binding protein n=1 Tax=uncultured Bacteroides sp. TaxID=162156 RepID=UPI0026107CEE|nr:HU family DNA-binding protein [uncultured Bacteroides sp.]